MEDTGNAEVSSFAAGSVPAGEKPGRWIFWDFIKGGVIFALVLSLGIFALYTAGSIPDPGFSDSMLFFLLGALRSVSLVNCTFSLFAMGLSVHRLVNQPSLRKALPLFFYFATALVGAFLTMLESLMVAASGGNI